METTLKWLNPNDIVKDWSMNPRDRDEDHIRTIARHMNDNGYDHNFPVICYSITDGSVPNDIAFAATGFHRLDAAILEDGEFPDLPLKEVYCEMRTGTIDDVIVIMMTDNWQWSPASNSKVGKMPSTNEIRSMRYRLMLLPTNFIKSNYLLAKEWNCGETTVRSLRNKVVEDLKNNGDISIPYFTEAHRQELFSIIEKNMYLSVDGKMRKPTTKDETLQMAFPGMSNLDLLKKEWVRIDTMIAQAIHTLECPNLLQTYMWRRLGAPRQHVNWDDKDYKRGIREGTAFLKDIAEPAPESDIELLIEELTIYNEAIEIYKPLSKKLTRPFLHPGAENAAKEFDNIGSADWEAKDRSERLKQLRSLITRFNKLHKAELKAREEDRKRKVDQELQRTAAVTEEARQTMWKTFEDTGMEAHVTKQAFAQAACKVLGLNMHNQSHRRGEVASPDIQKVASPDTQKVASPNNVILGKDHALVQNLPISEAMRWRSHFEGMTHAITSKAEWVQELLPRPEEALKGLKLSLKVNGNLDDTDGKESCKIHNITQEQFDTLKKQAIEEGCAILREYNTDIKESARIHFSEQEKLSALRWEDLWKEAIKQKHLDGLSVHTFSGAYSKDTFNDYEILLQEKNALTRFESDVRFWRDSNWIKDLLPTPAVDTENSVGHTEILGIHLTTKTKTGNEYETYFGNETGISSDLKRPLTDISKKTLDELLKLIQPI